MATFVWCRTSNAKISGLYIDFNALFKKHLRAAGQVLKQLLVNVETMDFVVYNFFKISCFPFVLPFSQCLIPV